MKRTAFALMVVVAAATLPILIAARSEQAAPPAPRTYRTWSAYGGGPEQIRYSKLDQINRSNVKQLQQAWIYDSGETGGLQTQPIVVDDVLYGVHAVAQDVRPACGDRRASVDLRLRHQGAGPESRTDVLERRSRRQARLCRGHPLCLRARCPRPANRFRHSATAGASTCTRIWDAIPSGSRCALTSPGVVHNDLLILGGRVSEGLPASPGDVRAYDARTGKLRWSFHTIPHPGEKGYETWSKDSWRENGGANSWPGMALDEARGIVYVPTGSAAADFYGANRVGDNLYANSLLALNADTGKLLWHFQFVRHDIWDRDPPAPPSLVTIRRDGKTIDAVAQATKHGYVFVFDRVTGTPVSRSSTGRCHRAASPAKSPPIPSRFRPGPRPFARQDLTPETITSRTPEARGVGAGRAGEVPQRRPVRAALGRPADGDLSGIRRRRRVGRAGVRSGHRHLLCQRQRPRVDRRPGAGRRGQTGRGIYQQNCAPCHRDDLQGAPPQIASLAGIGAAKNDS